MFWFKKKDPPILLEFDLFKKRLFDYQDKLTDYQYKIMNLEKKIELVEDNLREIYRWLQWLQPNVRIRAENEFDRPPGLPSYKSLNGGPDLTPLIPPPLYKRPEISEFHSGTMSGWICNNLFFVQKSWAEAYASGERCAQVGIITDGTGKKIKKIEPLSNVLNMNAERIQAGQQQLRYAEIPLPSSLSQSDKAEF